MPDKASAAGWVIEVVTLRQGGGPPLYKYFNVAIAEVAEAVEATRKQRAAAQANRVGAVRPLSSGEIAALRLRAGQVKPA
jgi:hypothetical protein